MADVLLGEVPGNERRVMNYVWNSWLLFDKKNK